MGAFESRGESTSSRVGVILRFGRGAVESRGGVILCWGGGVRFDLATECGCGTFLRMRKSLT